MIEENALRIKNKISAIWENNVRSRRLLYWQSLRNKNIAMKHETWLQEDNIILPQWLQMKNIANEPENVTKRREKQVLDNFKTENELLLLRSESQETKYKDIDTKVMTEIEKQATGQSRNYLTNMRQKDCRRNEEISKKRWQNKNLIWLNKYEENFRRKYQNKNPFIKEPDETERAKTYAEISAEQPKARRQRPNLAEKQRQEGGQNKDPLYRKEPQEVAEIRNWKVKQQGRPIQDRIKKISPCQIVTQQMEMMIYEMIIPHRLLF